MHSINMRKPSVSQAKNSREDAARRQRFVAALEHLVDEGYTWEQLAKGLDVSASRLRQIRSRSDQCPSQKVVHGMARWGVNPQWLWSGLGERDLPPGGHATLAQAERNTAQGGDAEPEAKERWLVSLDREEQLLVALYRAAELHERTYILRTVEQLSRPAAAGTQRSTSRAQAPSAGAGALPVGS